MQISAASILQTCDMSMKKQSSRHWPRRRPNSRLHPLPLPPPPPPPPSPLPLPLSALPPSLHCRLSVFNMSVVVVICIIDPSPLLPLSSSLTTLHFEVDEVRGNTSQLLHIHALKQLQRLCLRGSRCEQVNRESWMNALTCPPANAREAQTGQQKSKSSSSNSSAALDVYPAAGSSESGAGDDVHP